MHDSPLILLVDDDPSIRKLCSRMLQRLGFDLIGVENGRKSRELVKEHGEEACAILLDINLPDMSGSDLTEEFYRMHPKLPVIFFTGSVTNEETVTQNGKSYHFLKKPFSKADLIRVLEKSGVAMPVV